MPRFQSTAARRLRVVNHFSSDGGCGTGTCREVPDVSADGDLDTGLVTYEDPGEDGAGGSSWQVVGGTSIAAPLWAAVVALTDAQPRCRDLSVGDLNPALYALAGRRYHRYFRDVDAPDAFTHAASNNTDPVVNFGRYRVRAGYDLATGLGAPHAGALAPALCRLRTRPRARLRHR